MIRRQINVSLEAYDKIKEISKADIYRGRGITGVVDEMVLGHFTTAGSGRPRGTKGIKHRSHRKPQKDEKSVDF